MSLFMLHTDIVTDLIQAKSPALDRRIAAAESQNLCISAVTRGELLCGLSQHRLQTKCRDSEPGAGKRKRGIGDDADAVRKATYSILAGLTAREARALRMEFGIDAGSGHTLEESDKRFDAIRERIRSGEQTESIDKALDAVRERIRSRDRTDPLSALLDGFLTRVPCLPWDAEAATHFARIAVDLHLSGSTMGSMDTMIAGHAVAVGAVLVSNSERQFSQVRGLKTENWTRK